MNKFTRLQEDIIKLKTTKPIPPNTYIICPDQNILESPLLIIDSSGLHSNIHFSLPSTKCSVHHLKPTKYL